MIDKLLNGNHIPAFCMFLKTSWMLIFTSYTFDPMLANKNAISRRFILSNQHNYIHTCLKHEYIGAYAAPRALRLTVFRYGVVAFENKRYVWSFNDYACFFNVFFFACSVSY